MKEKQYSAGEVLFREGDSLKYFFLILDGSAEVFLNYGDEDALKLADAAKDEFLGEMAIIESSRNSATAVAGKDGVKVLQIGVDEINDYFNEHPEQSDKLVDQLCERLRVRTDEYKEVMELTQEALGGQENSRGKSFWDRVKWFTRFRSGGDKTVDDQVDDQQFFDFVCKKRGNPSQGFAKKVEKFPSGTMICKEGQIGHCMYEVHWGRVGIYSGYNTDKEILLTELYPNSFFGEMGLIGNKPRSTTAVALEDTTLELILKEDLHEIVEKNPPKAFAMLRHLSRRLRALTKQYEEACDKLYQITRERD